MYVKKFITPVFNDFRFLARMQHTGPTGPQPTTGRVEYDPNIMHDRQTEHSFDYLDEELKPRHTPFLQNPYKWKPTDPDSRWTGECPW